MNPTIEARQNTIRGFVAGRRTRALYHVDPPAPSAEEIPADLNVPKGRIVQDARLQIRRQLWENERRLAMPGEEDWVPALHPYIGTGVLASAFGAETVFADEEDPWTKRLISGAAEALSLSRRRADSGLLGEVLERTRRMREAGGPDYPVRVTDIQSPLDTALLLWEQADFFISMHLAPKAVHHVLDLVTDLTIEFVRRQRDAAGQAFVPLHWPPSWWPANVGLGASDDILPLIGPKQYEEFSLPYLARLSEAFGGLMVHSCGNFTQNLEVLARVPGLRMVDFGVTEQPVAEAAAALPPEVILSMRVGLNTDPHFDTNAAFVEHVFSKTDDPTRLWVLAATDAGDPSKREALLEKIAGLAAPKRRPETRA